MHHSIPLALLAVLACTVWSADEAIVFSETFEDAAAVRFAGAPAPAADGDGKVLRLTQADAAKRIAFKATLDLTRIAGRRLGLTARVKAEAISEKPKPYNGVKVMVVVTRADGTAGYGVIEYGTGSWDWKAGSAWVDVPSDAKQAIVVVGLEHVTGTAWIDDVAVRLLDPAAKP